MKTFTKATDNQTPELVNLEDVLMCLIKPPYKDFYARVASLMTKQPLREEKDCSEEFTMAVSWSDGYFELLYNFDWIQKLIKEGLVGIYEIRDTISHEMTHIQLGHIPRSIRHYLNTKNSVSNKVLSRCLNISLDGAANASIRDEYPTMLENKDIWIFSDHSLDLPNTYTLEWMLNAIMYPENDLPGHHCSKAQFEENEKQRKEFAARREKEREETGVDRDNLTGKSRQKRMEEYKKKHEEEHGPSDASQILQQAETPESTDSSNPRRQDQAARIGRDIRRGVEQMETMSKAFNYIMNHGHDQWLKSVDGMTADEAESIAYQIDGATKQLIIKAVEQHTRMHGNIPHAINQLLIGYHKKTKVPWAQLYERFIKTARRSDPVRSFKRPSKSKLSLETTPYPGHRRSKTYRILVLKDQSGSMSNHACTKGLTALQDMQKVDRNIVIDYAAFDTQVGPLHTINATDKIELVRERNGGTDFDEAFSLAKARHKRGLVDLFIIFTDGGAPPPHKDLRPGGLPVLWCIEPDGVHPCPGYGHHIIIND